VPAVFKLSNEGSGVVVVVLSGSLADVASEPAPGTTSASVPEIGGVRRGTGTTSDALGTTTPTECEADAVTAPTSFPLPPW